MGRASQASTSRRHELAKTLTAWIIFGAVFVLGAAVASVFWLMLLSH